MGVGQIVAASRSSAARSAAPTSGESRGSARARSFGSSPSPRTAASIASRAMTRYVVYFPPPTRMSPFASTTTRCSRDAVTVDPPDGAISGRRPAYVPTMSSRRRSTSSRPVDGREQLVDLGGRSPWADRSGRGRARPSCRSASGPGHGTRNTTLPGTLIVSPTELGIRSRRTTRWAPRLGTIRVDPPRQRGRRIGGPDPGRVDDDSGPDDRPCRRRARHGRAPRRPGRSPRSGPRPQPESRPWPALRWAVRATASA